MKNKENFISVRTPDMDCAMTNEFDLTRFVDAQKPVFETAIAELRAGRKRTHWRWFIFPQLGALGRSETAKLYGLRSIHEAMAYFRHPALGPRLIESAAAVLESPAASLHDLFGSPDDLKFRSCMTLFHVTHQSDIFRYAIEHRCGGQFDEVTFGILVSQGWERHDFLLS